MSQSKRRPGGTPGPRPASWTVLQIIAVALTVTALGLAACSNADGDENGAGTTSGLVSAFSVHPVASGEIVMQTRVNIPAGKILAGSSLGDSPFCPGGKFHDGHGSEKIGGL